MKGKVDRIYPEAKTALIKWIEDHFHEIDEFVVHFDLKDGTCMTVHDVYSYRNALGMIEMAKEAIQEAVRNDEFIPKERNDDQ